MNRLSDNPGSWVPERKMLFRAAGPMAASVMERLGFNTYCWRERSTRNRFCGDDR
jgi:hypothetical protein